MLANLDVYTHTQTLPIILSYKNVKLQKLKKVKYIATHCDEKPTLYEKRRGIKTGKYWRPVGYIGFRSANNLHRVDLKPGTRPLTIFISGPFGLRKGPRSEYGIDFKTKK